MDLEDRFTFVLFGFTSVVMAAAVALLVSTPVFNWQSAGTVAKQLNSQCGTHYTQYEVFVSGKELIKLCRISNQTLTVK